MEMITMEAATLSEMIERLILMFGCFNILGGLGWMTVGSRIISVDREIGEMMERISLRAIAVGCVLVMAAGVWNLLRSY